MKLSNDRQAIKSKPNKTMINNDETDKPAATKPTINDKAMNDQQLTNEQTATDKPKRPTMTVTDQ
jgi:hypothetical protein